MIWFSLLPVILVFSVSRDLVFSVSCDVVFFVCRDLFCCGSRDLVFSVFTLTPVRDVVICKTNSFSCDV